MNSSSDDHRPEDRGPLGRRFRALAVATVSSNTADGMFLVVLPLLILRLTDDPLAVSVGRVATQIPAVLLSVAVGTVVDMLGRRSLMAGANLVRAGMLAVLVVLVWQGHLELWSLMVIAFLLATLELVYDTATTATVPTLVGRRDLERANGTITAGQQVTQGFIAAPLGAAALAFFTPLPMAISLTLFVVSVALVATAIPRRGGTVAMIAAETSDGFWARTIEGLKYVRRHAILRRFTLVATLVVGLFNFAQGTYAYYLVERLGVPEALVGTLAVAPAIGGIIGAATAGRVAARVGRFSAMLLAAAGTGVTLVSIAGVPASPLGWVLFAVANSLTAVFASWWNVLAASARQRLIPTPLMGRVSGAIFTIIAVVSPIATLASGFLARIDARLPWLIGGVVLIAIVPVSRGILRDTASTE